MDFLKVLETYSNVNAGSGDEKELREEILKNIQKHVDNYKINVLGNLLVYRYRSGGAKKIQRKSNREKQLKSSSKSLLITAHLDEVSMLVSEIEENGLIRFKGLGGFIPKILPATAVVVGNKKINGVIGLKSLHNTSPEERNRGDKLKDLYIDVGALQKSDVQDISPGNYVYFTSKFYKQGHYCFGKAFDDRVGVTALTHLLTRARSSFNIPIIASFNSSEEIGLRGGAVCSYDIGPILFNLNLEGTTCADRDLKYEQNHSTTIGKGPAITVMDRTSIASKRLLDFVVDLAKKNRVPYQFKRTISGGTDAGRIHLRGEGIPSITISCPVRYLHSPWGIIDEGDFKQYLRLSLIVAKNAHKFGK